MAPAATLQAQLATAVTEAVALRASSPLDCIAYSLLRQDPAPCSALTEEEYCLHHDLQAALQSVLARVAHPSAATLGAALLAAAEAQRQSGVDELRAELERVEAERARLAGRLDLLEPQERQPTGDGPPREEVRWQEYVTALEPLEPLDVLLEPLTEVLEPARPRGRAGGAGARPPSVSPPRRAASATERRGPARRPKASEAEAARAAGLAPGRSGVRDSGMAGTLTQGRLSRRRMHSRRRTRRHCSAWSQRAAPSSTSNPHVPSHVQQADPASEPATAAQVDAARPSSGSRAFGSSS